MNVIAELLRIKHLKGREFQQMPLDSAARRQSLEVLVGGSSRSMRL